MAWASGVSVCYAGKLQVPFKASSPSAILCDKYDAWRSKSGLQPSLVEGRESATW